MDIKINKESMIECPWCNCSNLAEKWNNLTFEQCTTREMRRAFKDIYNLKVWGSESKNFYICPECKMWIRGNQLILLDDNNQRVKEIGGRAVMRFIKTQN